MENVRIEYRWVLTNTNLKVTLPVSIYLYKVNNENTRTMREICSILTIKIPERHHWPNLNRFHTLFWCFHCWLWTASCVGTRNIHKSCSPAFVTTWNRYFLIGNRKNTKEHFLKLTPHLKNLWATLLQFNYVAWLQNELNKKCFSQNSTKIQSHQVQRRIQNTFIRLRCNFLRK